MIFRDHAENKEVNQEWIHTGFQTGSRALSLNHTTKLEKLFQTSKKKWVNFEAFHKDLTLGTQSILDLTSFPYSSPHSLTLLKRLGLVKAVYALLSLSVMPIPNWLSFCALSLWFKNIKDFLVKLRKVNSKGGYGSRDTTCLPLPMSQQMSMGRQTSTRAGSRMLAPCYLLGSGGESEILLLCWVR